MTIADQITRSFRQVAAFAAACLLGGALAANAFVIRLDGTIETASALYATGTDGTPVRIVQVGDVVTGGGHLTELGKPASGPDGSVAFAAEVRSEQGAAWNVFDVAQSATAASPLHPVLDTSAASRGCRPVLKTDPEVGVSGDGSIYFIAENADRRDTLFRYANGHVTCMVAAGDRTAQRDSIASIYFGSARVAKDGAVVFKARLASGKRGCDCVRAREAILLSTGDHRVSAIAREGDRSPGGGRYAGHFGAPAIAGGGPALIVAFTDRDEHGMSALFLGPPRRIVRTIATGLATAAGPLTYISDGSPGMSDAGYAAIRVASGARGLILSVRDGESSVAASEGDTAPAGWTIAGFDDPILSPAGQIEVETSDRQGEAHIVKIPAGAETGSEVSLSSDALLFPHSLSIGQDGRSAFLAAPSRGASESRTRSTDAEDGSI